MSIFICDGGPKTWSRRAIFCPTCKRTRPFVQYVQEWYGPYATCCGCGDAWGEGELLPRPFKRGWRKESIAKARARWAVLKVAGR